MLMLRVSLEGGMLCVFGCVCVCMCIHVCMCVYMSQCFAIKLMGMQLGSDLMVHSCCFQLYRSFIECELG